MVVMGWSGSHHAGAPTVPPAWRPDIWHTLPSSQQPVWPGPVIGWVREALFALPGLVAPADVRALRRALAGVRRGRAFVLQGGDCAEPFGAAAVAGAGDKLRILAAMATAISVRTGVPTTTVGRIAGQFAKPRSAPTELVDGRDIPSFRGLIVNGREPTEAARRVRASRLLDAYRTAHHVLAELDRLGDGTRPADPWWSAAPARLAAPGAPPYGTTTEHDGTWRHRGLWTSHEALVLDYEEPLTRLDEGDGHWYLTSAHLPWVGARTNRADGAHVAFLSGVANPVACKVGPDMTPAELVRTCGRLDPGRAPGRLTLITRLGAAQVRDRLPRLVSAVRRAGHPVIWMCDPMHGNTFTTPTGLKTRRYEDIADELRGFFSVLADLGEWPGGVHLEVAGDDVTECVGGDGPTMAELPTAYRTLCDPRVNDAQAMSLAGEIADLLADAVAARPGATGLLAAGG